MTTTDSDVYYDPFDFEIDTDPYPIWRRLREERPLYYNEHYDFYALSRFDDVERGLIEWKTYSSAKGTLLEIIKSGMEIPPGSIIFEDPPGHNMHRSLLSRVFTPRKMNAIEPKIREFCARTLDPLIGTGGFDFIADLGAQMPMRVIGMLLGIPEQDQQAMKDLIDDGLRLAEGTMPDAAHFGAGHAGQQFRGLHRLAGRAPVGRPHDRTPPSRVRGRDGHDPAPHPSPRSLNVVNLLAAAGNETTTRLIGWTGKVLAEHPDERRKLVEDRSLVPNAIEELLRFEPPSPIQARYVMRRCRAPRRGGPRGERDPAAQRIRQPRRPASSPTATASTSPARSTTTWPSVTACTSASVPPWPGSRAGWPSTRCCSASPTWEVDCDRAEQARTSTVRGWESLPVVFP